ncbi:MAG: hypothetical protein ABIJ81_04455 [Patescibacteria group bacterium]
MIKFICAISDHSTEDYEMVRFINKDGTSSKQAVCRTCLEENQLECKKHKNRTIKDRFFTSSSVCPTCIERVAIRKCKKYISQIAHLYKLIIQQGEKEEQKLLKLTEWVAKVAEIQEVKIAPREIFLLWVAIVAWSSEKEISIDVLIARLAIKKSAVIIFPELFLKP